MSLVPGQNPVWTIQADQQPPGEKDRILSWKHVYSVCRWILRGTQWFGTAVILVIFAMLAASLLAGQSNQANSTLIASLLGEIQQQQLLTLVILGLLLFLIVIAWILMLLTPKKDREPSKEEAAKKREEALLKAENALLVTERSALQTEERKAAILEQLLEVEREQTTLLKELTLRLK